MLQDLALIKLVSSVAKKAKEKAIKTKEKWDKEAEASVVANEKLQDELKSKFMNSPEPKKEILKDEVVLEKKEDEKKKTKKEEVKTQKKKVVAKKPKKEDPKTKEKSSDKTKSVKKSTKTTSKGKTMTKREEKIVKYSADVKKHYGEVDEEFLTIVVKNLGPSIYKKDAETVACSDKGELDTVKKNFLKKKLGLTDSDEVLDAAIKEVCEEMKSSKNKYRATFYYALAKKLKKESALS